MFVLLWASPASRQFESECEALRFGRDERLQPYPAFVQRRIGAAWPHIRSLSERHDRVRRSLDLLNSELRALEELKQTTKLRDLLSFAELAALVSVAYHGHDLLKTLISEFDGWNWLHQQVAAGFVFAGADPRVLTTPGDGVLIATAAVLYGFLLFV